MSPGPRHTLLASGFILAVVSCATVAVNPATEEAAIRARSAEFNRLVTAKNIDAIAAMHTPGAMLMMPNAPIMSGPAAVRQGWQGTIALPNLSMSWQPTTVSVAASGDVATEIGTYNISFDGPQGRITDTGHYTTVWHKVDGTWLVASDMATSSQPLPPPPPAPGPPVIADMSDMETRAASGISWTDLVVPGFASGAKMAVIHGDPGSTGDYTLRLQFPDGYEFPPHWHPNAEHVTVLSGVFRLGMGGTVDSSAIKEYQAGDFLYIPGRMPHFGGARGATVIQLHGMGPFAINLGAP
jgi:ketosteroid isomerase-like protein/quercetin dioxygenase-like cupin family protein